MKIYLVGGAVRDKLLGRPVKEKDWVVVGATPEHMIEKGYMPVGKDFPVFLHPKTKEEYALARTERKSGKGYKGFICYSAPDVTLEEDLKRRDLTINAIAESLDGELIDPYGGQADMQKKCLRHVSPAFAEDPLRVLRVARFVATFEDFSVHPETLKLMQSLSTPEELHTLSGERLWKELEKALHQKAPIRFFETLKACGALNILMPEIKNLDLLNLSSKTSNPHIRLALLFSQLNSSSLKSISKHITLPKAYENLSRLVIENAETYKEIQNKNPEKIFLFLKKIDALRQSERFITLTQTLDILQSENPPQASFLKKVLEAIQNVKLDPKVMQALSGKEIGAALDKARIERIEEIITG